MYEYLDSLNDAQRAAVENLEGPMLVIAGAGSGKTRVLTYRIVHLLNHGVDPFRILSLTFTNKAAKEMKQRIAAQVGRSEAKNLWMGTFHSVFAKILRFESDKLGYPANFTIYDAQDSERLIRNIIKEMMLDKDVYKSKQVFSRISSLKNSLITVKSYHHHAELLEADTAAMRPRIVDIYKEYVERCFKAGAMDFDDLLLRTNELLTRFPDVLVKYQERFQYIMVDEYQDTNHSQYLIVKALADMFKNLCVVGDDAQSIYAFRGANVKNIMNFQKDYPYMKTFRLEQNYRSTNNIVQAANNVIANNREQLEKDVWTANSSGEKINVVRTITDNEEARYVANNIYEKAVDNELDWSDFAILYRTNMQSRALEDAMRRREIPYRIYGGLSFYQRKEVKDLLSYFRLVINPKDEEALRRIINFPMRGIGQTTMDKLAIAAGEYKQPMFRVIENVAKLNLGINAGTVRKLNDFVNMIKAFGVQVNSSDAFVVADNIVKSSGLIKELQKDTSPEGVARYDNMQEVINGVKRFVEDNKEQADGDISLSAFLQDVALLTDADKDDPNDNNRVSMMTIHMSKGLEFPYVNIVGMEEDLFPSGMSVNTRAELEEERRLFYVAVTRAEKQATLSYTQSRYRWGKISDAEPSRFIEEVGEDYLEYVTPRGRMSRSIGDGGNVTGSLFGGGDLRTAKPKSGTPPKPEVRTNRRLKPVSSVSASPSVNAESVSGKLSKGNFVKHERFGTGEVLLVEGVGQNEKATVNFEKGGIKKVLLKFARLEILR
ncbi:MAG: UvrD-helicase domain-containing protein [Ichthyobacteriaceae bacterium]|nr:UvrD-helicase domain-containing protein [Ichthyobacteriaceae bacterium]